MLPEFTLQFLAAQKIRDAEVLSKQDRKAAAIYLMGYAVEFSLKKKIIKTLGFDKGFPETVHEFNSYSSQVMRFNLLSTGIQISSLRQIKNHNLSNLITYSGVASRIIIKWSAEWHIVVSWNPEDRYRWRRYNKAVLEMFMNSAKIIIKELVQICFV